VVVLIGAGIGVTPFTSVLESMVLSFHGLGTRPLALQKGYFYWLNKDQYSFEWFAALLARIEAADKKGVLDIHICMTSGRANLTSVALTLARAVRRDLGGSDIVTGLRTATRMGAPDWERELSAIAARHAPETVDVFFCGPHGLGAKLAPACARLGMRFRQERF
jgi:predicted ferric reductase